MEITDDNKIYDRHGEDCSFKYNFINTPWDDRSTESKIGIVSLLVLIAATITTCVVFNLLLHYRGFKPGQFTKSLENTCHLVKKEDYSYVARIHSVSTKTLLCVGAVIRPSSVLANEVCVKSGPIRLQVGSSTNPRCKRGFSVDGTRTVLLEHEGVISKKLIILETYESMEACSLTVSIGLQPDWGALAYIIGRPLLMSERSLTKQPVSFEGKGNCSMVGAAAQRLGRRAVVCVRGVGRCPVRAGDLLLQHDRVFGIASTSVHNSEAYNTAYFADLSIIHSKVNELAPAD